MYIVVAPVTPVQQAEAEIREDINYIKKNADEMVIITQRNSQHLFGLNSKARWNRQKTLDTISNMNIRIDKIIVGLNTSVKHLVSSEVFLANLYNCFNQLNVLIEDLREHEQEICCWRSIVPYNNDVKIKKACEKLFSKIQNVNSSFGLSMNASYNVGLGGTGGASVQLNGPSHTAIVDASQVKFQVDGQVVESITSGLPSQDNILTQHAAPMPEPTTTPVIPVESSQSSTQRVSVTVQCE